MAPLLARTETSEKFEPNGFRVILIDDDPAVARVHARMLKRGNFEVVVAGDGETALEQIVGGQRSDRPFCVAVVDVCMPGWDGLETIERARALDPDLQVVLCTGTPVTESELHVRFGVTDTVLVVKKPVASVELVQAVLALSTKREQTRDLERLVRERTAELAAANAKLTAELEWRDRVEAEMRIGQRLEAIGQVAAGVAHEISTPVQYIGDNAEFITEATGDLLKLVDRLSAGNDSVARAIEELDLQIDIADLITAIPNATRSIQQGVTRIATLIGAMRELSHPGGRSARPSDVNKALESALEVTAASYRYQADVTKHLTPLPPVTCHIAELGQVFLNLIVNAAHAMENPAHKRGTLGIASRVDGTHVVVSISDTGCGIPEAIRDQVFAPFFTTKELGRGTGQGLAISKAIIVERHRGTLTFDSTVGQGTTFHIRLPIAGAGARE
ncbi:MAG: ATP-binding protein [Kofleriaceae bacterium]